MSEEKKCRYTQTHPDLDDKITKYLQQKSDFDGVDNSSSNCTNLSKCATKLEKLSKNFKKADSAINQLADLYKQAEEESDSHVIFSSIIIKQVQLTNLKSRYKFDFTASTEDTLQSEFEQATKLNQTFGPLLKNVNKDKTLEKIIENVDNVRQQLADEGSEGIPKDQLEKIRLALGLIQTQARQISNFYENAKPCVDYLMSVKDKISLEMIRDRVKRSQDSFTVSVGDAALIGGVPETEENKAKDAAIIAAGEEGVGAGIVFADKAAYQEQCFLLSQIKKLLELKNKMPQRLPYTEDGINRNAPLSVFDEPFGFMNRMTQAKHSYNLFNFTTQQLSALVPTIRLYKIMTSSKTGKDLGYVEIKFDTNPTIKSYSSNEGSKSALDLFRSSNKRGIGVGLKDFNFTLHGSDPFAAKKAINGKVTIFANSFGDLIKERIGEVVRISDIEDKSEFLDKNYKFADLALRTGKTPEDLRKNLSSIQKDNLDKLNFRLKVVVGWSIPSENSALFNSADREAINDSFMNLNLTPTTHEFSFDEMGGVTFSINYLAYIEDYFNNSMFNIFSDKEVEGNRIARKMLYDYLQNFNCSANDIDEIKKADAQNIQLERVKSFRRLFTDLMLEKRMLYYNLSYTEISNFIKTGRVPEGDNLIPKIDGQPNTTEIDREFDTMSRRIRMGKGTNEVIEKFKVSLFSTSRETNKISFFYVSDLLDLIMRNIDETLEELSKESDQNSGVIFNYSSNIEAINPELKDKLDKYFKEAKENKAILKEIQKLTKAKEQFRKLRIVLGPMEIKDPFNETETYPCTIGDIPVSLNYFTDFLTDRKLSRDESSYPISNFIKDLTNDLIRNFLNTDSCFSFNTKQRIRLNSATVSCYNRSGNQTGSDDITYFITNPKLRESLGRRNVLQLYNNSNLIVKPVLQVSGPSRKAIQLLQADREYNYQIFYAGRSYPANLMSGNSNQDLKHGIFHYVLGKDRGLVKNISLERTDMPGLKELRFEQEGFDGLTQLREVYNANIDCLLNLHTFPGNYIYIEPRGFSPEANIDYTQFGIGGYYMITRSEHSIGPGKADTKIIAKWVSHASKEENNQNSGIISDREEIPRKCISDKRSDSFAKTFADAVTIHDPSSLLEAAKNPIQFGLSIFGQDNGSE